MRNRVGNVLWGLAFIIVGIGFAGNIMWGWNFELFFEGWWTLFIIVPCAISLIQRGPRLGNLIGIAIGVLLLLSERYDIDYFGDLIVPAIFIIIGVSFIFRDNKWNKNDSYIHSADATSSNKEGEFNRTYSKDHNYQRGNSGGQATAVLSSKVIDFSNQLFDGVTLNSVLGSITLDLRNAEIKDGAFIDIAAVFGGVDIVVPSDVEVRVQQVPILGGVSNKASNSSVIAATLYVNATCILGGVTIK
ncbi:MAG: LiaF domain-containing protein [Lachnotalea sp.]